VILDLNLPNLGGLELLRRLVKISPRLPILVFSLHTEAIYAIRAMEAGARGFVSKNADAEELLSAVEAILAGGTAMEREVASEIAGHAIGDDAYLRPLSERDLEILRLLAGGNSLVQIAGTLGIAYKTVANTLSIIKEKLGVTSTADLIRIAIGRGLADLT
jgi:DNA-binding NarL/FixJ family response regulator